MTKSFRSRTTQLLASMALGVLALTLAPMLGAWTQATTAQAQDGGSVSYEFRSALSPYGSWKKHPRWGEVWVVHRQAADWRPYTRGRWIWTDEWGWYWDVAGEEYAWGWVTHHYGRWAHDRELGWVWIPGEDWGPAWVDWRQGDDYVGWAPLPPDDLLVEYRDDPIYWSFVQPRYLLAPRVFLVCVPPRHSTVVIRRTVIVNRTAFVERGRDQRRHRVAVNAGIEPGIIARATGRPIRAAKVEPAVLRGTKVEGTREVGANEGRHARTTIRTTNNVIEPAGKVERPRELGARDTGRIGERLAERNGRGTDKESRNDNRREADHRRESGDRTPINVIRGSVSGETGRNGSTPPVVRERESRPPPPPAEQQRRGEIARANVPSLVVRRPPPPPSVTMRASSPPPQVSIQRRSQETRSNGGGNRGNNRQQQDQRGRS